MDPLNQRSTNPWYRGRAGLVLLAFLAIGGYFVITEHWAHLVPFLPWLLLAACPLLHIFLHGGHSGHGGGSHAGHSHGPSTPDERSPPSGEASPPTKQGGPRHD